jgi:hypothetical protein
MESRRLSCHVLELELVVLDEMGLVFGPSKVVMA